MNSMVNYKYIYCVDFLLNNDYHEQRTIVVCNMMEEAMQLADRCRLESLSFVMVHEKSSDREIGKKITLFLIL